MMGMGLRAASRGRGLGERLLRAALDQARAAGVERVSLSVYAQEHRSTGAVPQSRIRPRGDTRARQEARRRIR